MKVMLFDSDHKYRQIVKDALINAKNISLIADFEDAYDVLEKVWLHQPDVVVLAIQHPSGSHTLLDIKKKFPDTPVLVLTLIEDDTTIFSALQNGASGYILEQDTTNLEKAIQDIYTGNAYLSPAVAARMLTFFKTPSVLDPWYQLTRQETEILKLMVAGKTQKQIAIDLSRSYDGVRAHIKSIYKKIKSSFYHLN